LLLNQTLVIYPESYLYNQILSVIKQNSVDLVLSIVDNCQILVFISLTNTFIVEEFVRESLVQIKKENSTISIIVIE
jgi:hypothetical protein